MMDAFSVMRQIILKELRHLSMKITPFSCLFPTAGYSSHKVGTAN